MRIQPSCFIPPSQGGDPCPVHPPKPPKDEVVRILPMPDGWEQKINDWKS